MVADLLSLSNVNTEIISHLYIHRQCFAVPTSYPQSDDIILYFITKIVKCSNIDMTIQLIADCLLHNYFYSCGWVNWMEFQWQSMWKTLSIYTKWDSPVCMTKCCGKWGSVFILHTLDRCMPWEVVYATHNTQMYSVIAKKMKYRIVAIAAYSCHVMLSSPLQRRALVSKPHSKLLHSHISPKYIDPGICMSQETQQKCLCQNITVKVQPLRFVSWTSVLILCSHLFSNMQQDALSMSID